jgi:hypothetical protein
MNSVMLASDLRQASSLSGPAAALVVVEQGSNPASSRWKHQVAMNIGDDAIWAASGLVTDELDESALVPHVGSVPPGLRPSD